jgi:hypothetical protein
MPEQVLSDEKKPAQKPFPWRCPRCRQLTVNRVTMPYRCQRTHNGQVVTVEVPNLVVPRCSNCGEVVFDYGADEQIRAAFRTQLGSAEAVLSEGQNHQSERSSDLEAQAGRRGASVVAKLTVVVGLPGSGKTHLIRNLRARHSGLCVEDFMAGAIGSSSSFTHSKHYPELIRALREGRDCAIADIEYCDTSKRLEVEQVVHQDVDGLSLEWVFFENNLAQCLANLERRNGPKMVAEKQKAQELSRRYIIPQRGMVVPVWRPDESNLT